MPTNQYADLKKIFKGKEGRNLRKNVSKKPGLQNLLKTSKKHNIKSWIVFSAEAYRSIVANKKIGRNAPKRIRQTINDYILNNDVNYFWNSLTDLKTTIYYSGYEITVYLTLIAKGKNWIAPNGQRYFTMMLDQIFNDIQELN